ncbi:lycopene cyclase domain-containing protein [Nocardia colli]|uniref:Lycopene cyclase domain-containing protein n=1 Tax=Nocardia colli TaxID=2545717 RepID=A0A5N0EAE9_9NOCA|nr:lycopene cyclase domain-containing protein [Nocardia colli]KAA8885720.1 lycopene cyclase domain-containing protein [Nocardia colli]
MAHWQYLLILVLCLVLTAPLEFLGPGVYRRPRLLLAAIAPALVVFVVWDLLAIAGGVWSYDPRFVLGVRLPGSMPVEEFLFFLVIPLCGLLTFGAVETLLARGRPARVRIRDREAGR